MDAYPSVRELCEAMESGTIPWGNDAAVAWLSAASDRWIVEAADLFDALEPVPQEPVEELGPGAAALTIVMLLAVGEGVDEARIRDDAFLAKIASLALILVTWEMMRRSGGGVYELRGPLFHDPESEPIEWKRRPTPEDLEKCIEWRRLVFAN
jgi:hypothetical protein